MPFAEDVTFEGPLMPKLAGRQLVLGFLARILPMVKDIRLKQHTLLREITLQRSSIWKHCQAWIMYSIRFKS